MPLEHPLFRKLAILILVLNGLSATAGGIALLWAPDGSLLGMPLSFLEGTPFPDYRLPGLVLLLFNGLSSLIIAIAALRRHPQFGRWILLQGLVLAGWLSVQLLLLQNWAPALHLTCYTWAAILILYGWRHR
jgi:hypothetical protein